MDHLAGTLLHLSEIMAKGNAAATVFHASGGNTVGLTPRAEPPDGSGTTTPHFPAATGTRQAGLQRDSTLEAGSGRCIMSCAAESSRSLDPSRTRKGFEVDLRMTTTPETRRVQGAQMLRMIAGGKRPRWLG